MLGQTRLEFIFGVIIFALIIFYIADQANNTFSTIISDYDINNVKAEANNIVEVLTTDKGYPNNWNDILNQGWNKRREIKITPSSNELKDQQVRINITYDSDMKSDFSDIRFTDSDKVTNIPYWIESKSDNNWAVFWVKLPKIPSLVEKPIYMYYNNPSAASESNGNNVFIQFLDLSGSSLPAGWVKQDIDTGSPSSSGTATVSNGLLTITNTGGSAVWQNTYEATHVYKNSTTSGDFVVVAKITGQKNTDSLAKAGITVQNFVRAKNYNGMSFIAVTPGNGYSFEWQSSSYYIATNSNNVGGTVTFPTYLKLIRNNSYVSGWYSTNGKDWIQQGSFIIPKAIEDFQYITLIEFPHNSGAIGEANFSMFYVYQYSYPEPIGTSLSEETRTNQSWFPIKNIGLASGQNVLSSSKIDSLSKTCDLMLNFGIDNYRLKIYNSTNLLLYCGTDSLKPAQVVVSKYIMVENSLGNITLELW